jgi:hypothetical protein
LKRGGVGGGGVEKRKEREGMKETNDAQYGTKCRLNLCNQTIYIYQVYFGQLCLGRIVFIISKHVRIWSMQTYLNLLNF